MAGKPPPLPGGGGLDLVQHIKEEVMDPAVAAEIMARQQQQQQGRAPMAAGAAAAAAAAAAGTQFWPERPTKADPSLVAAGVKANTVLTNLQRGNIPTMQTIVMEPVIASLHQRAGQGELKASELNAHILTERDPRGRTPLMWSAFYGQTPTVALLLAHGADADARGDEEETALHLAAAGGHHDVVKAMLRSGRTDPDPVDENACTPLMFAAARNHPHAVNELLLHGADVTAANVSGDTALSLAMRHNAAQAQAVIEQHLAALLKTAFDGATTS